MLNVLRLIGAIALMVVGTTAAQAQFVTMGGQYTESNGFVVNIPNNQPNVICGAGGNINATPVNDARCHGVRRTIYQPAFGPLNFATPQTGVPTRATVPTIMGGLNAGDTFTVPTGFFGQTPPTFGVNDEAGPVINNAVIWISSGFTGRMPAAARAVNPPASTRIMRKQGNGPIAGQPLRPTGAPAVRNVVMIPPAGSSDTGSVTYTEGPNKFGGTMAVLLDGVADLYIKTAAFDAYFPTAYTPVLGVQHVGDPTVSLMERNAAGWDYGVLGGQIAGVVYGPTGTGISPCPLVLPATPPNCNQPPPFSNYSMKVLDVGNFLPAATSTKKMFPWTTGSVTMVVHAVRGASGTFTETLTGMGYDDDSVSGVRNVGLVAGSYTARTAGTGKELASQVVGINIQFTPEPASAIALFAGVGLLGFAAARRRS
jgi:hypothetical protein